MYKYNFSPILSASWAAIRILGPPDVYPSYGDIDGAWTPDSSLEPTEYFQVTNP